MPINAVKLDPVTSLCCKSRDWINSLAVKHAFAHYFWLALSSWKLSLWIFRRIEMLVYFFFSPSLSLIDPLTREIYYRTERLEIQTHIDWNWYPHESWKVEQKFFWYAFQWMSNCHNCGCFCALRVLLVSWEILAKEISMKSQCSNCRGVCAVWVLLVSWEIMNKEIAMNSQCKNCGYVCVLWILLVYFTVIIIIVRTTSEDFCNVYFITCFYPQFLS